MNDFPVDESIEMGILTAIYFPSFRFALKTLANPPFPMNSDSVYLSKRSGGSCFGVRGLGVNLLTGDDGVSESRDVIVPFSTTSIQNSCTVLYSLSLMSLYVNVISKMILPTCFGMILISVSVDSPAFTEIGFIPFV